MPLGKYKTWDQCIEANKDKKDPEAYCGKIEANIKEAKKKKGE